MYRPPVVTVPADADQATAVLLVPDTYAVNCCCPALGRPTALGESETDTWTGWVTVTKAEADLVESAALVAVIVYVPAEDGAVYKPPLVTVPPEAAHNTA